MSYKIGEKFYIGVRIVCDESFEDNAGHYHTKILAEDDGGSRFWIVEDKPALIKPEDIN